MPFHLPADADLSSDQMKLFLEWTQAIQDLDAKNLAKHMHDDFTRVVHPKSLGLPAQNKEEWLKETTSFFGVATGVDTTVHSIIEGKGKVVVHTTGKMENPYGLDTTHESIAIAHLAPDKEGSTKIIKLENFYDSKVFLDVGQALMTAMATAQTAK